MSLMPVSATPKCSFIYASFYCHLSLKTASWTVLNNLKPHNETGLLHSPTAHVPWGCSTPVTKTTQKWVSWSHRWGDFYTNPDRGVLLHPYTGCCFLTPAVMEREHIRLPSCCLGNYRKAPLFLGVASVQNGSSQFSRNTEGSESLESPAQHW